MRNSEIIAENPPDPETAPWLVVNHIDFPHSSNGLQSFYSISRKQYYTKGISWLQNFKFWQTCRGWMVTKNGYSGELYMLNPCTKQRVYLEPSGFDLPDLSVCVLSSSPTDPKCKIVCLDLENQFFHVYDRETNKWSKHNISMEHGERIFHLVNCNGIFYGIANEDAVVVIDFAPDLNYTVHETIDAVEFPPAPSLHLHCFLESCNELFCVRVYSQDEFCVYDLHIQVLRRDFAKETWAVVDDIGDRVFFLSYEQYAASVSATELGMTGNCIYFIVPDRKCLYMYDMDEDSLSVHIPSPSSNWLRAFWMMPAVQ